MTWREIFRRGLVAILIAISLLSAAIVAAAVQSFHGGGEYIMSDYRNMEIAQKRVVQRAKEKVKKEAALKLKEAAIAKNAKLTDAELDAIANGTLIFYDIKITTDPFGEGSDVSIFAALKGEINADEAINDFVKRDEKEKATIVQQNQSLQEAIEKNDKLDEDLREQYKLATTEEEKAKIREQMEEADRDFLANEKLEEGNGLYYAKDYEGAIKAYNEVLKFGEYAEAYNNRGIAYKNLGQYEQAIADVSKAIELKPSAPMLYQLRGLIYQKMGEEEKAQADFAKAKELGATGK